MKNKPVSILLKLALVGGLLYFLAQKGFLSVRDTMRAFDNWPYLATAVAIQLLTMLLGVLRWQLLLHAQGIRIAWLRVFQLTLIGNFFNVALPGAVSGDFVKAFYIGREMQGHRARAFGSILFDRVAGLSALVLVSATSFVVGVESYPALQAFVLAAAIAVISFYGYLFLVREHHDPLLRLMRAVERKIPKAGSVTRVYEGMRHYHNHRLIVAQVLLISIVIHLLVGVSCREMAIALGEPQLAMLAIYVVVPLGLLVTAVPVAPAGVGTGNAAFAFLFKIIGSSQGGNIYTLYALTMIFIGALGGLVYLQFRSQEPRPDFGTA